MAWPQVPEGGQELGVAFAGRGAGIWIVPGILTRQGPVPLVVDGEGFHEAAPLTGTAARQFDGEIPGALERIVAGIDVAVDSTGEIRRKGPFQAGARRLVCDQTPRQHGAGDIPKVDQVPLALPEAGYRIGAFVRPHGGVTSARIAS